MSRLRSTAFSVSRSAREGTQPVALRVAVAGILGAVVLGILVLRLWALTVLNGADYAARANSNVVRRLPIAAPRGKILDRNGEPIVANAEMRQVVLDLHDVRPRDLPELETKLGRVLAASPADVARETAAIRDSVKNAPPGALEPVLLKRDETRDNVVFYLAEHRAEFPGVDVRPAYKRTYRLGSTAAHVLGQIGQAGPDDLKRNKALVSGDRIGVSGIEKTYDEYLRGVNGYNAVSVDAAGVRTDAPGLRGLPATPGRNLELTLDLPTQRAAENGIARAVRNGPPDKKGFRPTAAAAVAIDPSTGDVLSLASYPTYDPNVFSSTSPRDQAIAGKLNADTKRQPLLNRAIQGVYAPGSTYKVITSLAALETGLFKVGEQLPCPPYKMISQQKFKNHTDTNFGLIGTPRALEMSCDTFYYVLGIKFYDAKGSQLQDWSRKFGLGRLTGIDIPGEAPGLVPTPEWKKRHWPDPNTQDHWWSTGTSANLSIGQGDLTTTPLQMTNVYATIANGGKVYQPHLALDVQSLGGKEQVKVTTPKPVDLHLNPAYVAEVKQGLNLVTTGPNGTATAAFAGFPIQTGGKSGTAEKTGQGDLAWYCGFAPLDDPKIAACVFIDGGGHGGNVAAPIVRRMFAKYLKINDGKQATSTGGARD